MARRTFRGLTPIAVGLAAMLVVAPPRSDAAAPQEVRPPAPGAVAATPPAADGLDEIVLDDFRTLRARVASDDGKTMVLAFPSGEVRLPRARVREVRLFRDFDPAPRDDAERAKAAQGLVRWGGKWVSPAAVGAARQAEEKAARKRWEENEGRHPWPNRWILNTKHFTVEANLAKADADRYATMLEAFYDYFTAAFKVALQRRIPVRIFRTRAEFDAYRASAKGAASEHTVGYFVPVPGKEELVLFHDRSDTRETVATLLHECTHLLLYLARPEIHLPTWANEGLAEYYSAVRFDKGRVRAGLLQEGRLLEFLEMADAGKVIPVDELLRARNPDVQDGAVEFGLDHYAQSWAMVHFLMQGKDGAGRQRLANYLNEVWKLELRDAIPGSHKGYMIRPYEKEKEAFRRCLKAPDADAFLKEVVAYARGLPLDSAESWLHRAYAARRRKPRNDAAVKDLLDKALARAGDDPVLLDSLAGAYASLADPGDALERIAARLAAADPLDAGKRAWVARLLGGAGRDRELALCLEIDPAFEEAPAVRAWLAYRGTLPGAGSPAEAPEAAALVARVDALDRDAAAPPAALLAGAADALRAGLPLRAKALAERAAKAAADPVAAASLVARAEAAAGNAAAAAAAMQGALRTLAAGDERTRRGHALLEAVLHHCWALGLDREAHAVSEAWHSAPSGKPAGEAGWILRCGAAARAGAAKACAFSVRAAIQDVGYSEFLEEILLEAAGAARSGAGE
jgi:hypothetical protein